MPQLADAPSCRAYASPRDELIHPHRRVALAAQHAESCVDRVELLPPWDAQIRLVLGQRLESVERVDAVNSRLTNGSPATPYASKRAPIVPANVSAVPMNGRRPRRVTESSTPCVLAHRGHPPLPEVTP
jgi:hypothetical protein